MRVKAKKKVPKSDARRAPYLHPFPLGTPAGLSPLAEFMLEVEPHEAHEAVVEFQLNWCEHSAKHRSLITESPDKQTCNGCGLIWPTGRRPPTGENNG